MNDSFDRGRRNALKEIADLKAESKNHYNEWIKEIGRNNMLKAELEKLKKILEATIRNDIDIETSITMDIKIENETLKARLAEAKNEIVKKKDYIWKKTVPKEYHQGVMETQSRHIQDMRAKLNYAEKEIKRLGMIELAKTACNIEAGETGILMSQSTYDNIEAKLASIREWSVDEMLQIERKVYNDNNLPWYPSLENNTIHKQVLKAFHQEIAKRLEG